MPNYCSNNFYVTGSKEDVDDLKDKYFTEDKVLGGYKVLDFNKVTPSPEEDWYDFRLENWGTIWEMCDIYSYEYKEAGDTASIYACFSTAWSPPMGIYEKLIELYKDSSLKFEADYYENGEGFAGEFKAKRGEVYDKVHVSYGIDALEEYYAYIFKKEHESPEFIEECIHKNLENKGYEEVLIELVCQKFSNCYINKKYDAAARIYINTFKE